VDRYRIRALSADEMEEKVSKDVKRLRRFEQGLLAAYQAYLDHLDSVLQGAHARPSRVPIHSVWLRTGEGADLSLTWCGAAVYLTSQRKRRLPVGCPWTTAQLQDHATLAVEAMCTLLVAKPSFNFASNLLDALVPCTAIPEHVAVRPHPTRARNLVDTPCVYVYVCMCGSSA
jgi:hypothetical protein